MSVFTDFCKGLSDAAVARLILDFCHLDEEGIMHPDAMARIQIEDCSKQTGLAYHDAMTSLRQYVLSYGAKRWAQALPPEKKIARVFENGCLVKFHPQQWINDYAVSSGPVVTVDITEEILSLTAKQIAGLDDDSYDSDELVDLDVLEHSGPFFVDCVSGICDFFGVDQLADVTEEMIVLKKLEMGL